MVLSEDNVEFDVNELLIDPNDPWNPERSISIIVTEAIDEDGDDSISIKLHTVGMSWTGIKQILAIAYRMAEAYEAEEGEDEDDD